MYQWRSMFANRLHEQAAQTGSVLRTWSCTVYVARCVISMRTIGAMHIAWSHMRDAQRTVARIGLWL
jgi:hypothetical protein